MTDRYARYERLAIKRHPDGILEIVMGAPGKLSTADHVLHRELAEVWLDVDKDPETRVAILRGEGKGFSAGGDMKLIEDMIGDFDARTRVWREAIDAWKAGTFAPRPAWLAALARHAEGSQTTLGAFSRPWK